MPFYFWGTFTEYPYFKRATYESITLVSIPNSTGVWTPHYYEENHNFSCGALSSQLKTSVLRKKKA